MHRSGSILRLSGTIAVAVFLCLALFALLSGTEALAAAPIAEQRPVWEPQQGGANPLIIDRRRISIPFGIAGPLILQSDGHVYAEGKAVCDEDMTSFRLRSRVTQGNTGALARSNYTTFDCAAEGNSEWTVTAQPHGPNAFQTDSPADLCVMVLFYRDKGPVDVFEWCYLDQPVESP